MRNLAKHTWTALLFAILISLGMRFLKHDVEAELVSVSAVHYFPVNYRIDEFYVNSHAYGSSSFDGLAGGGLCCAWLPKQWKPGITVDVSWSVTDWTRTPIDDKINFDAAKIRIVGMYRAKVIVEKYDQPDDLFIHFFDGGYVRVTTGIQRFGGPKSLLSEIASAKKLATKGRNVSELVTQEDRAAVKKEFEQHQNKYGDWR